MSIAMLPATATATGAPAPTVARARPVPAQAPATRAPQQPAAFQPIVAIKNNGPGFKRVDDFVRQHGGAGVLDKVRQWGRGNEPGVVAYLPNNGNFFFSASKPTVAINGAPVRPTVVINPKTGNVFAGVGNFYVAPGPKGHLWFWNALTSPGAMHDALSRSRTAQGKEVTLGSASLGIAVLPQCRQEGAQPGLATTPGYGTSLRVGLVARDGQLQFKVGNLTLAPAMAQAAMSATAEILSRKDALVCRGGNAAQQASRIGQDVAGRLNGLLGSGSEAAQHAAGIAGLAAALAGSALGGLVPQEGM